MFIPCQRTMCDSLCLDPHGTPQLYPPLQMFHPISKDIVYLTMYWTTRKSSYLSSTSQSPYPSFNHSISPSSSKPPPYPPLLHVDIHFYPIPIKHVVDFSFLPFKKIHYMFLCFFFHSTMQFCVGNFVD